MINIKKSFRNYIAQHTKTKCKQNGFISCHRFDGGNENSEIRDSSKMTQ